MKRVLTIFLLLALATILPTAGQVGGQVAGLVGSGEFIVTLKAGESLDRILQLYRLSLVSQVPESNVYLLRQQTGAPNVLDKLLTDPALVTAEPNAALRLDDSGESAVLLDDSAESALLLDTHTRTILNGVEVLKAYADQRAISIIEADKVRGTSVGAATRVVTIDTGVDFNHHALKLWLEPGIDLVNNSSASEFDGLQLADSSESAFLLDDGTVGVPRSFGHGTLVAGAIHAVAPGAVITPIKAFDAYGRTSWFTIIKAVYAAVNLKPDAINMSFSTSQTSPALRIAINAARAVGITLVASMGNSGMTVDGVYPGSYENVIGVAATDFEDHVAGFSNRGKSVSVSAPGAYVISTYPGNRYAAVWGTSFSAPLVSGTVALVASQRARGEYQGQAVMTFSDAIADKNPGYEKQLGRGRLNARRALLRR